MDFPGVGEQYRDRVRLPIAIAIILFLIYLVELLLAGSFESGAAYSYLTSLPEKYDPILRFLAPYLHSSHSHIAVNLVMFLVLSLFVLAHKPLQEYLTVFLAAGWFTSSIMPGILGGGIAFGISGGIVALAGWETVFRYKSFSDIVPELDSVISLRIVNAFSPVLFPASIVAITIFQSFGFIEVGGGVSVLGHFTGAMFGLMYGIVDVRNYVSW